MPTLAVPTPDFLDRLRAVVGDKGWITDSVALAPYLSETRGNFRGDCAMVVRPASTDEVARVVGLCSEAAVAVVPLGGNTGLVGGGVPTGGIVLSLERMTRIRAVDCINHTITVEAGCILVDVQNAAADAGAFFPLSLAAEGSCRIGGNLSTNAGGINVLRYGNARDLVLGLEVVLPSGQIWDGLRGLRKDNTGYDLKQLFIGAEGTLGVITAAVLKLFPKPRARVTALAGAETAEDVLALFARARDALGDSLIAFEFWSRRCHQFVLDHVPGMGDPLPSAHPFYALMEVATPQSEETALREKAEAALATAHDAGTIGDATIAANDGQRAQLWKIRESIPEAQKHEGASLKHDIAVPISRVAEFLRKADARIGAALPGARVCAFGHIGDGNIHYNLSQPTGAAADRFIAERERISLLVNDLVEEMGGSFSAEHGVGQLRLRELERYKTDVEIDLMRCIKAAIDPVGIMNPGKVVPS